MDRDWVDVSTVLDVGVYALLYSGRVVYIGQSTSMLRRLYEHSANVGKLRRVLRQWECFRFRFDEIWVRPCGIDELDGLEAELIAKHAPMYNRLALRKGAPMPDCIRAMLAPPPAPSFNRRGL